jgi:hypothetical protein
MSCCFPPSTSLGKGSNFGQGLLEANNFCTASADKDASAAAGDSQHGAGSPIPDPDSDFKSCTDLGTPESGPPTAARGGGVPSGFAGTVTRHAPYWELKY